MSKDKLDRLDNITTALSAIPEFIKHFLNYLFEIPNYPIVFCRDKISISVEGLPGHEQDIRLILCSFPQVIDKLHYDGRDGIYNYGPQSDIDKLIDCCHAIYHDVLNNNINIRLEIRHLKSTFRGVVVKFVERLIEANQQNQEKLTALKELRNNLAPQTVSRLQFLANAVLRSEDRDTLLETIREEAAKEVDVGFKAQ